MNDSNDEQDHNPLMLKSPKHFFFQLSLTDLRKIYKFSSLAELLIIMKILSDSTITHLSCVQFARRTSFYSTSSDAQSRNVNRYKQLEIRMTQQCMNDVTSKSETPDPFMITSPRRITAKTLFGPLLSPTPPKSTIQIGREIFTSPTSTKENKESEATLAMLDLNSPAKNTRLQMRAKHSESVDAKSVSRLLFGSPSQNTRLCRAKTDVYAIGKDETRDGAAFLMSPNRNVNPGFSSPVRRVKKRLLTSPVRELRSPQHESFSRQLNMVTPVKRKSPDKSRSPEESVGRASDSQPPTTSQEKFKENWMIKSNDILNECESASGRSNSEFVKGVSMLEFPFTEISDKAKATSSVLNVPHEARIQDINSTPISKRKRNNTTPSSLDKWHRRKPRHPPVSSPSQLGTCDTTHAKPPESICLSNSSGKKRASERKKRRQQAEQDDLNLLIEHIEKSGQKEMMQVKRKKPRVIDANELLHRLGNRKRRRIELQPANESNLDFAPIGIETKEPEVDCSPLEAVEQHTLDENVSRLNSPESLNPRGSRLTRKRMTSGCSSSSSITFSETFLPTRAASFVPVNSDSNQIPSPVFDSVRPKISANESASPVFNFNHKFPASGQTSATPVGSNLQKSSKKFSPAVSGNSILQLITSPLIPIQPSSVRQQKLGQGRSDEMRSLKKLEFEQLQ